MHDEPHPSPHRWNSLRFTRLEAWKTKEGSRLISLITTNPIYCRWAYSTSVRTKVQKPWPLRKPSVLGRFFEFQAQVFFLATIAEELEKNSSIGDRRCTCFVKSQPFRSFVLWSQSHSCISITSHYGAVSRVKLMDYALGTHLALNIQSHDHPVPRAGFSFFLPP